jgi:hypothetical protein
MDMWLQSIFASWGYQANQGKGSGTEPPELAELAQRYFGLSSSQGFSGWTIPQLQEELANGYPVVVRVRPQMVSDYPDAHYMVLLGMDNQWVYVDDPGIRHGAQVKYSLKDFIASWARKAQANGENNQGVTIHPNGSPPPPTSWTHTWGGSKIDYLISATSDASGNIYFAGYTYSFGEGDADVLVLKYDSGGNLLWARTWGGVNNDFANGIGVDASGNIYVVGQTDDSALLLLKFTNSGTFEWARAWTDVNDVVGLNGFDLAFDGSGDVYVVGGGFQAELLKVDPNGNLLSSQMWQPGSFSSAQ